MNQHPLQLHFRQTFLAGIFAVVPVAVTIFIVYLINQKTSDIEEWVTGKRVPFVGILIALMLIYLAGLAATRGSSPAPQIPIPAAPAPPTFTIGNPTITVGKP